MAIDRPGTTPEGSMVDADRGATRERPSRHGAIVGEALAKMAEAGRREIRDIPEMCATCAFRPGCMTNQMAATLLEAVKCVLGIDPDKFACHHGMRDGWPTRLCAGAAAAQAAPWDVVQNVVGEMSAHLQAVEGPDEVRAAFDAWLAQVDPDNALDDYQRARLYARRAADGSEAVQLGASDASTGTTP